jgi:hypothetical protein
VTTSVRLVDGATTIWLRPAAPARGDPIICGSHALTSAARRDVVQAWPGRSGVNNLTAYTDEATFQANLIIRDIPAGLTRHQQVDQLRALLHPRSRPWLYIQRDGWLTERCAEVVGGSITSPIDSKSAARLEVSLQVDIPDGMLRATSETSATLRPPVGGAAGRIYPKVLPWAYAAGGSGLTQVVANDGDAPTPVLMRLYGACTEPVITNQTTGEVFELDNLTLVAGQYLQIDMDARTVWLNGDPGLSYYAYINFATSSWWQLDPGNNSLSLGAATADGACELDVFFTPRYTI